MTKIDLITGILGSGKTTFLRRYAEHIISQGKKIAILENDFGAVNIDTMILQDLRSENCQIETVAGGCGADCHKRRFKTQLIALGMQHFDRIIVEPSGIFDMDEFFDTIHESPLDRWFETGNIITIIDAETDDVLPPQMEYLFASEAACCGKLFLSKRDRLPDKSDAEIAEKLLSHLNRSLENIRCDRRFTAKDLVMCSSPDNIDFGQLLTAGYRASTYVKEFGIEDIVSNVHYFMHVEIPPEQLEQAVGEIFSDENCGKIMRIKGSVPNGKGGWLKLNATPEKCEISPVADGQAVIIVIGDSISKEHIDGILSEFNTDAEYVSI